jgi:hypothetical protein
MAKVKIEGQTLELDDEIAQDDDLLRAALQPSWPDAKTAQFTRTKNGDTLTVQVTKKAGTKGNLIDALLTAKEGVNPAIAMSRRIAAMQAAGEIDPVWMEALRTEMIAAADLAERYLNATQLTLRDLEAAPAVAGGEIPVGF